MIAMVLNTINVMTMVFSGAALLVGFGASYMVWQLALKNKSKRISQTDAHFQVYLGI